MTLKTLMYFITNNLEILITLMTSNPNGPNNSRFKINKL